MNRTFSLHLLLFSFLVFLTSCGVITSSTTPDRDRDLRAADDAMVLEEGVASWYGSKFHGKLTANGETYNMNDITAAHKTLPFNTVVQVDNLDNGESIVVRINDRGPYVGNRIIDLSREAARRIGMEEAGTANVRLLLVEEGDRPITDQNRSSRETFTVQIASFGSEREARTFSSNISGSRVEPAPASGSTVYRVYYGTYSTTEEAREAQQKLASQGIDGFVKQAEN